MIPDRSRAPALWLLADSRLPTGGHAHSGGLEAAVRRGLVRTPDDVAAVLAARIPTAGAVAAAAAAAACVVAAHRDTAGTDRAAPEDGRGGGVWAVWDAAIDARTPVAALRAVSRSQGRAMLRTVRTVWPAADVDALGPRPHQPLVVGVAAHAAGGDATDAAALVVHHLTGQVCSAAVRLLGLDPLALAAVHARALDAAGPVVADAAVLGAEAAAHDDPDRLPTATTPLAEILAVHHARSEGALFAS